jgi:vacuole morphology and inheritance protein 14
LLSDFLHEIGEASEVQRRREAVWRARKQSEATEERRRRESALKEESPSTDGHEIGDGDHQDEELEDDESDTGEGSGLWIPGQGVKVDRPAIVEILLQHVTFPGMSSLAVATCCRWLLNGRYPLR